MTTERQCQEKVGPNCGLCRCKLVEGHEGQHENGHGTKFPLPKNEDQWRYTAIATLEAQLAQLEETARRNAEIAFALKDQRDQVQARLALVACGTHTEPCVKSPTTAHLRNSNPLAEIGRMYDRL